jgi:hypothetical protein
MKQQYAPKQMVSARQRVVHAYCGKTSHVVAGALAEEPLGGLKSWPTSHDATTHSPQTSRRHGNAPCTLTAARGAVPLPALRLKNPLAA